MRVAVTYLVLLLLAIVAVAFPVPAESREFKLLNLQELSIDYKNFAWVNDKARDPLIYPEHPKESLNLNINTDVLFEHFYWNSTILSTTTNGQYRAIGLETRLGIRLTDSLHVSYYHRSEHLLDRQHSYMDKFPSQDAIEFKIFLFRAKPDRKAIFQGE